MAKVSVIVPIYKVEKFLEKCIQSIQNQTERDIEIILVDDESPDGSPAICDRYAAQDARIQVIHQKNAGVSVARNAGMAVATADWIMFVDGDDWLEENAVEVLYKKAIESNFDIVMASYYLNSDGVISKENSDEMQFDMKKEEQKEIIFAHILLQNKFKKMHREFEDIPVVTPWAKLYKKSSLERNQVQYPVGVRRGQDIIFNLYAAHSADMICLIHVPVYHYRTWEESAVNRIMENQQEVHLTIMSHVYQFVEKKQMSETIRSYANAIVPIEIISLIKLYSKHTHSFADLRKWVSVTKKFIQNEMCQKGIAETEPSIFRWKNRIMVWFLQHKLYYSLFIIFYIKNILKK